MIVSYFNLGSRLIIFECSMVKTRFFVSFSLMEKEIDLKNTSRNKVYAF